jgi:hypothetical protein
MITVVYIFSRENTIINVFADFGPSSSSSLTKDKARTVKTGNPRSKSKRRSINSTNPIFKCASNQAPSIVLEKKQLPEAQESTLVSLNDPLSSDSMSVAVAPLFLLTRK